MSSDAKARPRKGGKRYTEDSPDFDALSEQLLDDLDATDEERAFAHRFSAMSEADALKIARLLKRGQ